MWAIRKGANCTQCESCGVIWGSNYMFHQVWVPGAEKPHQDWCFDCLEDLLGVPYEIVEFGPPYPDSPRWYNSQVPDREYPVLVAQYQVSTG